MSKSPSIASQDEDVFVENSEGAKPVPIRQSGSGGIAALIRTTRQSGQLKDISKRDQTSASSPRTVHRVLSVPNEPSTPIAGVNARAISVSPTNITSRANKCSSMIIIPGRRKTLDPNGISPEQDGPSTPASHDISEQLSPVSQNSTISQSSGISSLGESPPIDDITINPSSPAQNDPTPSKPIRVSACSSDGGETSRPSDNYREKLQSDRSSDRPVPKPRVSRAATCSDLPESDVKSAESAISHQEPDVEDLKYENNVLKHQISHLKEQRSDLESENQVLREHLQSGDELDSPTASPYNRRKSSPAVSIPMASAIGGSSQTVSMGTPETTPMSAPPATKPIPIPRFRKPRSATVSGNAGMYPRQQAPPLSVRNASVQDDVFTESNVRTKHQPNSPVPKPRSLSKPVIDVTSRSSPPPVEQPHTRSSPPPVEQPHTRSSPPPVEQLHTRSSPPPVEQPHTRSSPPPVSSTEREKAVKTLQALLPVKVKKDTKGGEDCIDARGEVRGQDGLTRTERSLLQMQQLQDENEPSTVQHGQKVSHPKPSSVGEERDQQTPKKPSGNSRASNPGSSDNLSHAKKTPVATASQFVGGPTPVPKTRTSIPQTPSTSDVSRPSATQGAPSTSRPSATQGAPSTSRPSATQGVPSTSRPSATQGASSTSRPSATQGAPSTSRPSATQGAPSTSRSPATQGAPSTSRPPVTQGAPSTSRHPATQGTPSNSGIKTSITSKRDSQTPSNTSKPPSQDTSPADTSSPPSKKIPPPRQGAVQKTTQIKSDISWIKRRESMESYDSRSSGITPSQTMPELAPPPRSISPTPPRRPPAPYRSHPIVSTPSTPSSGTSYVPPPMASGRKNDPPRSRAHSFTRSTSDDSIASKQSSKVSLIALFTF